MSLQGTITNADGWFIGTDRALTLEIFSADGVTMANVAGQSLKFTLRHTVFGRYAFSEVGAKVFEKTSGSGISVTGLYDSDRATNTQRVVVSVLAADTAALTKGALFAFSLERIDAGLEDVYWYGTAILMLPATFG